MEHGKRVVLRGVLLRRIGSVLLLAVVGCVGKEQDQAFARSFLDHLVDGNSAGARDLSPATLAEAGTWDNMLSVLHTRMPRKPADSIRLVSWDRLARKGRTLHKVTFSLFAGDSASTAEIYLERGQNGGRKVNSVRIRGPLTVSDLNAMLRLDTER